MLLYPSFTSAARALKLAFEPTCLGSCLHLLSRNENPVSIFLCRENVPCVMLCNSLVQALRLPNVNAFTSSNRVHSITHFHSGAEPMFAVVERAARNS